MKEATSLLALSGHWAVPDKFAFGG